MQHLAETIPFVGFKERVDRKQSQAIKGRWQLCATQYHRSDKLHLSSRWLSGLSRRLFSQKIGWQLLDTKGDVKEPMRYNRLTIRMLLRNRLFCTGAMHRAPTTFASTA